MTACNAPDVAIRATKESYSRTEEHAMPNTQCPYCYREIVAGQRTGDYEGKRCHAQCVVVQLAVAAEAA